VPVPHQVADQAAIFANVLRAGSVRDARRLYDGRVRPHKVDDANETVVQDAERLPEYRIELHDHGTCNSLWLGHRMTRSSQAVDGSPEYQARCFAGD
jgi:hypothetical protein